MKRPDKRTLTRQLSTPDGFTARYYSLLAHCDSNAAAYEAVENEHKWLFGRRRYSSFDSFRVVKNRKLKN